MIAKIVLLLAVKTSGNFAEQCVLLLPVRFERPGENLLELVAVVYRRMKKYNVAALFRPAYFVLHSGMTVDHQRNGFSS